jgi:ATP-dependent Lhr-like helicase
MVINLTRFVNQINEKCNSGITVAGRTGDTKFYARKKKCNILCTTPESLAILLNSKEKLLELSDIKFLIIDEVHAMAENKRGTQLSLSIAHLKRISNIQQIIGLSATISPIEKAGNFLFGNDQFDLIQGKELKPVELLCALPRIKSYLDLNVAKNDMCKQICKIVRNEECSLIFCNTRSFAEKIAYDLKQIDSTLRISTHHSSMSKDERLETEKLLKIN